MLDHLARARPTSDWGSIAELNLTLVYLSKVEGDGDLRRFRRLSATVHCAMYS